MQNVSSYYKNLYERFLYSILILVIISFLAATCTGDVEINNISTAPEPTAADEKYANVYQPLDGKWTGVFKIFEDQELIKKDEVALRNISLESLKKPTLKMTNSIQVEQIYVSESPYFQTVTIKDTYKDESGNSKIVESQGVNKVQNGKMWCVVRKPDETVIHEGDTEGKHTILWQRNEKNPQKIEYFRETVTGNLYEIVGYGYYDGDDLSLMPKFWFYGRYERK